jgi:hypothetical protein
MYEPSTRNETRNAQLGELTEINLFQIKKTDVFHPFFLFE